MLLTDKIEQLKIRLQATTDPIKREIIIKQLGYTEKWATWIKPQYVPASDVALLQTAQQVFTS